MKTGFALVALLSVALAGCVNFGEKANTPAVVYYVLTDTAPVASVVPARADAATLLVLDTTAGGFYDTDQLVFSRTAGTRGQYQFARWTERPGKRFADLMRARLDRHGAWNVSAASGYVRGDLLLDTEMVEFYHDASREPGQVRLVLRAELLDMRQRTLLGRRVFEQLVPMTTYDAAGAAQASNVAASRALDELAAWLASIE
ncbi:MAG: ABC-type transport auxiliary lipoprotein family protein [Thiobacillus sp.]